MSEIIKWAIIALITAGALLNIAHIGRPREPIKPSVVVRVVVIDAAIIIAILTYWG